MITKNRGNSETPKNPHNQTNSLKLSNKTDRETKKHKSNNQIQNNHKRIPNPKSKTSSPPNHINQIHQIWQIWEREDLKAKRHKNRRQGRKRWNPERLSVVTAELPFPQKSDLPSLRNNQGINITTPLPNFYSYLGLAFLRCDVFFFADADGHDGPLVGHPSRGHAR
jgi:hypothetical protein